MGLLFNSFYGFWHAGSGVLTVNSYTSMSIICLSLQLKSNTNQTWQSKNPTVMAKNDPSPLNQSVANWWQENKLQNNSNSLNSDESEIKRKNTPASVSPQKWSFLGVSRLKAVLSWLNSIELSSNRISLFSQSVSGLFCVLVRLH